MELIKIFFIRARARACLCIYVYVYAHVYRTNMCVFMRGGRVIEGKFVRVLN
jgi:hypothetical protein